MTNLLIYRSTSTNLDAYPIKYHPNAAALKEALIARGRKWTHYRGTHHVQYAGRAVTSLASPGGCKQHIKYNVSACVTELQTAVTDATYLGLVSYHDRPGELQAAEPQLQHAPN